ncbi:glycosyltransferase family 2 protein, partial [Flavobacterium sp.]|uniref:glycosyltransferase family 2 protein n=1 Tax=Flavobacterium sp. TaxID=239 RepID=UPI002C54B5CE
MLSILIPTYNYNILPLVNEIQKQCLEGGIEFEILCIDDASDYFSNENQEINNLKNCYYFVNDKNSGRTYTRNKLAEKASFDWLLFLDADVIPTHSNFIKNYVSAINKKHQVIVGGYCYQETKPKSENIFRYQYGKEREEKSALKRNSAPYQYIFSGNFLIQKKIFIDVNFTGEGNYYGMDVFFSCQLFVKKIEVLHIENPIYHLGLETNQIFFEKSLKAVESRKRFLANCPGIEKISPLIKKYKTIKQYRLLPIAILFFKISEPFLKKLILNKNPNLFCFDIYRLG